MILVETYIDENDINNQDTIIAFHVFGYLVDRWLHIGFHCPDMDCVYEEPLLWMTRFENKVSNHICY